MRHRQLAVEYRDQNRSGHGAEQEGGGQVNQLERNDEHQRCAEQYTPFERGWRGAERSGGWYHPALAAGQCDVAGSNQARQPRQDVLHRHFVAFSDRTGRGVLDDQQLVAVLVGLACS